jgi:hypothetical protein
MAQSAKAHDTRLRKPPERTATAAVLADEAARIERALSGQQRPRTLHAMIAQGPVLLACGHCGTAPGRPCTRSGGCHLARFQDAERRGLITRAELVRVVGDLVVIAAGAVVRDPGPAITRHTSREDLEAALPHVRRHHINGIEDYLWIGGDRMSAAAAAGRLGVTERTVCRYRRTLRAAGGVS